MRKILNIVTVFTIMMLLLGVPQTVLAADEREDPIITRENAEETANSDFIGNCVELYDGQDTIQIKVEGREIDFISKVEYNLLCRCVFAEAGNQDIVTQIAIAETILNRVDDNTAFADEDSISDVIYSQGQYAVVSNGSIKNTPPEKTKRAVVTALKYRMIQPDVVYFNSVGYFSWAENYDKFGAMYLSSIQ